MFTLSEKIRVLNSSADVEVFDTSNAAVATTGAITNNDRLRVAGFGNFDLSKIANIKCRRAVPAVQEDKEFTVVAPAGIAAGDAVEVIISLETGRYQSEVLTTNHIGHGRTFKFQSAVLSGTTAANIRDAIVTGFTNWQSLFQIGSPLVTVSAGTAADDVQVQADLAGSISVTRVEIKRVAQGIAFQAPVSLALNVTNGVANEGLGLGKFLEESIQMSTPMNTDPYAVDTADSIVDVRGSYTEISFEYSTSYEENLGTTAADYGHTTVPGGPSTGGVAAVHSFALFCNEATMLGANNGIAKLAAIALLRSGVYSYLGATVDATPDNSEVMILADGTSVDTVAAFIA